MKNIKDDRTSSELPTLSRRASRFARRWLAWRVASGQNDMPSRHELRIEEISKLLPQITVIDVAGPESMIFRVTGTDLEAAANERPTGLSPLDLTSPEVRPIRALRLWSCASVPCGCYFRFLHVYPSGAELPFEGLTLPVRAKQDSQPVQLFTFFWRQDRLRPYDPPHNQLQTQLPDYYAYVDIGMGAPSDQDLPVLRLEELLRGEETDD
ncbi:MAG: hypothetical protein ACMVY4_09215 [Minwuia sp.]|uniref:hypothetical protein n=1 Tax=Minwuia sp. TaxID=2493630 RepID=UPI003A88A8B0